MPCVDIQSTGTRFLVMINAGLVAVSLHWSSSMRPMTMFNSDTWVSLRLKVSDLVGPALEAVEDSHG